MTTHKNGRETRGYKTFLHVYCIRPYGRKSGGRRRGANSRLAVQLNVKDEKELLIKGSFGSSHFVLVSLEFVYFVYWSRRMETGKDMWMPLYMPLYLASIHASIHMYTQRNLFSMSINHNKFGI